MKLPTLGVTSLVATLMFLIMVGPSPVVLAEERASVDDTSSDAIREAESSDGRDEIETKSAANPKFKCKLIHKKFGAATSPPTPEIDLMCPSGHFVTTASCSQKGSPVLNLSLIHI